MSIARLSVYSTALLAIASSAIAHADHAHPSFRLRVVGDPGSLLNSINDDRVAVGTNIDASGTRQAVRYRHGKLGVLAPLPGYAGATGNWVNDHGDVCGGSRQSDSARPTLWIDGQPSDLGAAPDGFPFARCSGLANDVGFAAGVAFSSDSQFARLLGFRQGDVIDLSLQQYPFNTVFNVNRRGVASAFAAGFNPGTLIFASVGFTADVRTGAQTVFQPLAGDTQTLVSVVTDHNTIYGFSFNDTTQSVVAFDPRGNGTGRILRTEPLGYGAVFANDRFIVETYSGTQDPLIYLDGQWVDLTTLIPNLGGFVIGDAGDMNKRGDLVGWGTTAAGEQRGFILEVDCD